MIKAVIFDLDGTIGNTVPLCLKAFHKSIEPFMKRKITDEEIEATFGPSEEGTIKALIPNHYDEGVEKYLYYYKKFHNECPSPFAGIIDLIKKLKQKGILVAMVTGKGINSAKITLKVFGMEGLFASVKTGTIDGGFKKEGIMSIINQFDIDPGDAYYVGDSPSDVKSARDAGIKIISAAWANKVNVEELKKLKPDKLFTSIQQFEEFVLIR